ncbi:hypothetical protein [Acholeplasma granularum]|uniref:hypothetical protein n=1 Tax=Acholeplasma granularum TaxID=264635 RepID=UPI00046FD138|nr:hypothetical protein [Acholeplasma granularum]
MKDPLIYLLIVLIVLVILYSLYQLVKKHLEKKSKHVKKIKQTLETYGRLEEKEHFMSYEYQNQHYSLLIFKVPSGSKFTFNSRTIWERRFGQKKIYSDQSLFSKMPHKKIVVIYPHEGPFMYHYDENEIRFTNYKERIWDMHIISINELEKALKEGF